MMSSVSAVRSRKSQVETLPPVRAEGFSSDGYQLTVARIVEILTDHNRQDVYYTDPKTQGQYRIGSVTALAELTSISKTTLERLLERSKAGVWVDLTPKTLYRLAGFINQLDPALVDPRDPEKREIRFLDTVAPDGSVWQGWELLQHLHNSTATISDLLGNPRPSDPILDDIFSFLKSLPAEQRQRFHTEVMGNKPPITQPVLVPAPTGYTRKTKPVAVVAEQQELLKDKRVDMAKGMRVLSSMVLAHIASLGVSTIPEYADKLLAQREVETLENEREGIVEGLQVILFQDLLPDMPTLTILAEFLPTPQGDSFGGDVESLLRHCGLLNGNDTHATASRN